MGERRPPSKREIEAAVRAWNAAVHVGDTVLYHSHPDADPQRFTTATCAYVLSGHTAVVDLEGKSGCVAIAACKLLAAATLTIGIPQTELDKWAAAQPRVAVLREFLEWCDEQKRFIASYGRIERDYAAPVPEGREDMIARFVGIDTRKLETERRAVLDEQRKRTAHHG